MKYTDIIHHPVMEWILFVLLIGFGIIIGYALNVDSVQDACNQHVIDNYFNYDMQLCLMKQQQNFTIPFGDMGDYSINYTFG